MLERSEQLSTLAKIFATVVETGRGRMALVSGDAGVGKTSLVARFCSEAVGSGGALWGALGVPNRVQAVAEATRLGIVGEQTGPRAG